MKPGLEQKSKQAQVQVVVHHHGNHNMKRETLTAEQLCFQTPGLGSEFEFMLVGQQQKEEHLKHTNTFASVPLVFTSLKSQKYRTQGFT